MRSSRKITRSGGDEQLSTNERRLQTILTEESLSAGDTGAGFSVSISGNFALIGAPLDDDNGANSGKAYVYQLSGSAWSLMTTLTASDAAADDNFGFSVSISGNIALIGSPNDDDTGADSGSVYVYENIAGIHGLS